MMQRMRIGMLILIVLAILTVAPATAQTFDNSGGGSWEEYMSFPITATPTEYAVYKIVINGSTWEVHNVTGGLEATGSSSKFWDLVQPDGDDIRVTNQALDVSGQQYFYVEKWDYSNKSAVIWVNLSAGSSELNIVYGNPNAIKSSYETPLKVFKVFDEFDSMKVEPNGAWCWFQDPRAVYANGKTFFGVVNSNGDVVIYSYNHTSKVLKGFTLHPAFEVDDHDAPAILILPDGRLMVFYSKHNGAYLYYRISTNPYDISSWDAEKNISVPEGVTYPNPVYLPAEDRIYVFFRTGSYLNKWAYIYSDDLGNTWSSITVLYEFNTSSTAHQYMKVITNGYDKIFFAHSGHPDIEADTSIYFFYYYNGAFYRIDGTKIADIPTGLPITRADMDLVYNASATGIKAWIWDIAIDENENPIIVFATFPSSTDHRYNYARWNGTAWEVHEVTSAGGYIDGSSQPSYSGGITIDKENPNVIYFSKQDPSTGQFEIYKGVTTDGGATWTFEQLTSNSSNKNVRPVAVRNGTEINVLWMYGVYDAYTSYNTVIRNDWDGNFNAMWGTNSGGYTVENGYFKAWGNWNGNNWYFNTLESIKSPAVILSRLKISQVGADVDLFIGLRTSPTGVFTEDGIDCVYDGAGTGTDNEKEIVSNATGTKIIGGQVTDTNWHDARIVVTSNEVRFWDDLLGKISLAEGLSTFYLSLGADTDGSGAYGYLDYIAVADLSDPANFGSGVVKPIALKPYILSVVSEITLEKGVCLKIYWNSTKHNLSELTFEIDLDGDGIYDYTLYGEDYICLGFIPARTYKIHSRVVAPDGNFSEYSKTIQVTYPRPIIGATNVINATGIVIWSDKGGNLSYVTIKPVRISQSTFTVILHHEDIYANETGEEILNVSFAGLAGGDKIWLNETVAKAKTVDLLHNGEPMLLAIPVENNSVNLTLSTFSTYTLVVNNTVAPPKIAPPEEMTIEELLIFVGIAIGLVAVVAGAIYLAKRTKAKTLARMESEFRFFRRLR